MLLSRLTLAFAVLILLSAVQAAFSVWAVRSASAQSALTRDAQQMLTEYQALAANKQRLLVWLAGTALTGQGSVEQRAQLLREMDRSLGALERLQTQPAPDRLRTAAAAAAGGTQPLSGQPLSPRYMQPGVQPIPLLRANFEAMQAYVLQASATAERSPASDQALMWLQAATVFDHHGGRDMRQVLATAIEQQRHATEQAMAQQSQALTTLQRSSVGLLLLSVLWGLLAAGYFVRRLHRPFRQLLQSTQALAEGDYRQRPISPHADEFAQIGQQLNALALRLDANQRQSEALRAGLDAAVAERTQALMRSHEALLKADARRQQFFAEISHELRTPVTVIRGEAEIALRSGGRACALEPNGAQSAPQSEAQNAAYRSALERIVKAAGALGQRVQELVRLARSSAGAQSYAFAPVPLRAVVQGAVHQMQAIASNRGIELCDLAADAARDCLLDADLDKLQQALVIVLDNAVRYSAAGSRVLIEAEPDAAAQCLRIGISDSGMGIAPEQTEQVFEPYFRSDAARQRSPEGLGLGLSIARAIVLAHRGSIVIEALAAGGSRVTIELPLAAAAVAV